MALAVLSPYATTDKEKGKKTYRPRLETDHNEGWALGSRGKKTFLPTRAFLLGKYVDSRTSLAPPSARFRYMYSIE